MRWLLILGILFSTSIAQAQTYCGNADEIKKRLSNKYSESVVAAGVTAGGWALEIMASEDGSTYTILATDPNGVTCVLGTGHSWEQIAWKPEEFES